MASSKAYLEFVMEQLSGLDEITYRAMMGEYILYYKGKIFGGIYDERLLVKPVKSAVAYLTEAKYELPYKGAKEIFLEFLERNNTLYRDENKIISDGALAAITLMLAESRPEEKEIMVNLECN